jgi:peptide deformylase
MILPIYAYGQPVLKAPAQDIGPDYPALGELIENMWETMYHANGVGLAAPQVGLSIRLFVIDTIQLEEEDEKGGGIKSVYINARVLAEDGEPWAYEEGCLSIPEIRGDVDRPPRLRLRYFDENFKEHDKTFIGKNARVIQHEYDHIEGILFVDRLKPLKKRLIRRKLEEVRRGKVNVDYKMKFARIR